MVIEFYNGIIIVVNGMVVSDGYMLFNFCLIVEDVIYLVGSEDLFIGILIIEDGKLLK